MNEQLTISDLQEKIEKVKVDLEELRLTGESSRKLEILSEYKEYLEDELKFLKNESRKNTQ